MPRQGWRRGPENALLMNRYDCELVRDGQKWRFKRITIDNAWAQGDPEFSTPWPVAKPCARIKAAEIILCRSCDRATGIVSRM